MKDFAPYQEALELKQLGFDEPCFGAHGAWGFMSPNDVNSLSDEVTQEDLDDQGYNEEDGVCLAPTYSQAFRWFREKYDLFIQPNRTVDNHGIWYYFSIETRRGDVCYGSFIYEEAELACLRKLIEIVKQKQ